MLAAECYDDGEGSDCPHGPFGSVHFDLFSATGPNAEPYWPNGTLADGADQRCLKLPEDPSRCDRLLRGPRKTGAVCLFGPAPNYEWIDGDQLEYAWNDDVSVGPGIYAWKPGETSIVLRLWESDGSEDGDWLGRRNDLLGAELVEESVTEVPCGTWVTFHRYTNDHPRQPTNSVAFRLRLMTITY